MNYQDSVRAILGAIDAAWTPTGLTLLYPNTSEQPPDDPVSWARLTLQHTTGSQRSIATQNQLYTEQGVLIVQIFTPAGQGLGGDEQSGLIKRIEDCLRAKDLPGGIFFMRVKRQELGISGMWWQTNVSGIFQYDERTS